MKAYLRSARIAPKKASLIARMVRGLSVPEALASLDRTNKKAARLIEQVIRSAAANATHNTNQDPQMMVVKLITVNKSQTYHRGVPMARGRIRRMRKFLSHISVTLGYPEDAENRASSKETSTARSAKTKTPAGAPASKTAISGKKSTEKPRTASSQKKKTPVHSEPKKTKTSSDEKNSSSSVSSDSSDSSVSS